MFEYLGYIYQVYYWFFPPKPWRQTTWDIETLKKEVLKNEGRQINLLILGPCNAGKSSFINSIMSIHTNDEYYKAQSHGPQSGSWTKKFEAYQCGKFCLFDSMGLAQTTGEGFLIDDLRFLLKGHIKPGYVFDSTRPIAQNMSNENVKRYFNDKPGLNDQMHCVIFVVDSTSISSTMTGELAKQIENMQKVLRDQEVPSNMILTKVDALCEYVVDDIEYVFKSTKVEQAVKRASELFGIDKGCIHPVRNYVDGFKTQTNVKRGVPLLMVLKQAEILVNAR